MPLNRAAFIPSLGAQLSVSDSDYPTPASHEVVIKTAAVAINPVDWKQQDHGLFIKNYPSIFGVDLAGTVEEVGSAVKDFAPGDRVIANPSCLSLDHRYGAFQLYVLSPTNVMCKIPSDMSFETAVVLPLAVNTSGFGLFKKDTLGLPKPSLSPPRTDSWILIYGGSTSNGSAAIQLAKAAGMNVLTLAGSKNHDFCRKLGADMVIDYKDPDWVNEVAKYLRGKHVVGAYDSVGTDPTTLAVSESLKLAGLDVSISSTGFIPEGLKGTLAFGTDVTKDAELAASLWANFLPVPEYHIVGNGLEAIQQAMDMQKKGVSAKKLVVKIA